jgi:hypothetical protein
MVNARDTMALFGKELRLLIKSKNLPTMSWENVLPDVLYSICSLLCTSTNATPHERLFGFCRRFSNGHSVPTWLINPGPVLLKRHVRHSKYEPLVEEIELLEANSKYSHVRMPDGRETTVATRNLAPMADKINYNDGNINYENNSNEY